MERFYGMTMVGLVFLTISTLMGVDHAKVANNYDDHNCLPPSDHQPPSSSSSSLAPPTFSSAEDSILGKLKCSDFLKEEMVTKALEHLKAPKFIKAILEKSTKFGICVANKFCNCLMVPDEPVIIGCLVALGLVCMKEAISGHVYACTLGCAKSMINSTNHTLDDEAIGDFCYSKCMRSV
ncbi:hypothetical protein PanWU01x14_219800 [Parasponia andersonii]|uniref:Prolamin-like domain containing protein n=1 Tax=Parasponia andersonii TaxID=3476 RepID=A0A2P5BQ77_PARAD|nr:hypothetical protein PanWU01x14_219800 [Parasponia andersonii]